VLFCGELMKTMWGSARACGWLSLLVIVALLGSMPPAHAQLDPAYAGTPPPELASRCEKFSGNAARDCLRVFAVPPLKFPERIEVGSPVKLEMSIHAPPGPGPFPAIVLLHTCAALRDNPQVRYYAEAGLRAGYAVFILDTYTQRGMGEKCDGRPTGPLIGLRARDASEALLHLARFETIDMHRVAAIGFSQGSRVLYWLAREGVMPLYTGGQQSYRAFVTMYGECYSRMQKFAWMGEHMAVPLLSLLGERDEDGDPQECIPRLEQAKAAGSPVEWHVFPGAGHSWDNPMFSHWEETVYAGARSGRVLQAYDAKVTEAARQMAFEFFARQIAAPAGPAAAAAGSSSSAKGAASAQQ
jgi:dienelactone hydrolase